MKGFLTIVGMLAALLPLQSLYARRAAKADPIDPEALKKVSFLNATGAGGYQKTSADRTQKD